MIQSGAAGFGLALSLILAIGAQNAFVLRVGLRRVHVFAVCLTCAVSDALLIVAGVAGFGWLATEVPQIARFTRWAGAAFLFVYGAWAFRAAWRGGGHLDGADRPIGSLGATLGTCMALTWLNPHVYLDTVVLLGTVAAQWDAWPFALGAVGASFLFFFSLGYGAALLAPMFSHPRAWQMLDVGIGCVMWALAIGLLAS